MEIVLLFVSGGGFFVKFSTPQDQDSLLFHGFAFFLLFWKFLWLSVTCRSWILCNDIYRHWISWWSLLHQSGVYIIIFGGIFFGFHPAPQAQGPNGCVNKRILAVGLHTGKRGAPLRLSVVLQHSKVRAAFFIRGDIFWELRHLRPRVLQGLRHLSEFCFRKCVEHWCKRGEHCQVSS